MRPDAALCRELLTDRRSDGELLAAFTSGPSEEAFAELVRRHGPLVWGACRRLLPNQSDAEDAFQAAFLVLVRRARRLTNYHTVAPWLHRVAVWTARNVRRKNARRLARFSAMPEHVPGSPAPDADLKADLDAALLALPARYRDPILLCHLQGFTRREAAERLGCAEGTLSAWLSRGLEKLRHSLRGLDPSKALSVAAVGVPAALAANTAQAAVAAVVAAASIPPTVSVLVEGVLHMLWMKKASAAAFAMCAVFAMGIGVGLGVRPESSGAVAQDGPGKTPAAKAKEAQDLGNEARSLASEYEELLALDAKIRAATDQLVESLKKGETDPKKLKMIVDSIAKYQTEAEYVAVKLKAVKDKLDRLKSAGKTPATTPGNAADIDKRLLDLKRQLDALKAEWQQNEKIKKSADARAAQLEDLLRKLTAAAGALELERAELAGRAGQTPGKAAYLEVTVMSKDAAWPYRVTEFDAKGKPVGSLIAENTAILGPLFSRIAKDPNGPKEVRLRVPRDTPVERVRAVLDACKAAGFEKYTIHEPQAPGNDPFDPTNPGGAKKPKPMPPTSLNNKADIEDYLKLLEAAKNFPKPEKVEVEFPKLDKLELEKFTKPDPVRP